MKFLTKNNSIFSIIQFKEQILEIKNAHTQKIVDVQSYIQNGIEFIVSASYDKHLKFWNQDKMINQISFSKKIISFYIYKDIAYVFDKFGDIYQLDLQNINEKLVSVHIQGNLATFTSNLKIPDQNILISCDEYNRIKIFDLNNIQRIIIIWSPYKEYIVKKIVNIEQYVFFLFKNQNNYQIDQLNLNQKQNEEYQGKITLNYENCQKTKIFNVSQKYLGVSNIYSHIIQLFLYQIKDENLTCIKLCQIKVEKAKLLNMDEDFIYIMCEDQNIGGQVLYEKDQQIIQKVKWN